MKVFYLPGQTVNSGTVAALGDFDGVHRAHREIINRCISQARAKNLVSCVYMLEKTVKAVKFLTCKEEKEEVIKSLGADCIAYQKTGEDFYGTSCENFVSGVLKKTLNAKKVIVGENYTFGKGGRGNCEALAYLCKKNGIETEIVSLMTDEREVISSTRIRKFIESGEIERANFYLGGCYFISGIAERGNRIGSEIGFPTANIYPKDDKILPKFGVYMTNVCLDGKCYKGITNVGVKPTVEKSRLSVEVHIEGIERELYGEKLKVEFLKFIRPERKFENIENLKKQIEKDMKVCFNK